MIRSRFDRELHHLSADLVELGRQVSGAIEASIGALCEQNAQLAAAVIEGDKDINTLARQVESEALKILLRQQPVASDLRSISTALKIVTDLERIGDQACDISSIVLHLCELEYKTTLTLIPQMAEKTRQMLLASIDSFVDGSVEDAKKVIAFDDEVDRLFAKVKADMIELIREHPEYADQAIYLMMVAKYFEKIGDHAENIAEWVIFCKTGERKNVRIL